MLKKHLLKFHFKLSELDINLKAHKLNCYIADGKAYNDEN